MGYLYVFEVYTGKGGRADGSPKGVISRLLHEVGPTGSSGRILYTDNFYVTGGDEVHLSIIFDAARWNVWADKKITHRR
jgi:hypothetical protein